ncbi:MAG: GAF domain-containing protein [Anaerolineae bacterium]|nr:GAF domain-containing protein [Anaerolineae bacterium]
MDALTRITLDLAVDLLEPMPPSQAQATTLARLDAAGFAAACLRLSGDGLQWACDEAHLSPRVLAYLRHSNRNLVGGLLSLPVDRALPFAGALVSLTAGFYDGVQAGETEVALAREEAGGALLLGALGAQRPVVYAPVAHRSQAYGLLLIWGDSVTGQSAAPAERLGRILGAALARATGTPTERPMPAPCGEALHMLQSVIAALSMEQPLEQSLAAIRDTLPKLMPGWLPPLFAVRDFEAGQWIWRPFMPDWATRILEEKTGVSLDSIPAPVGKSEAWDALSQGQAVYTQDGAEVVGHLIEPELARAMQRAMGIGCIAVLPLCRNGEVLGLMFAWSRRSEWSPEEKDLLQACAASITMALHNAQLYERQQRLLSRVSTMLARAENLLLPVPAAQRLQVIVDEAVELLNADAGALYVAQPDGGVEAVAYRGVSAKYVRTVCENFASLRTSRVMTLRVPARIPDMTDDPEITVPVLQAVLEEGLRSMIALPLTVHGVIRAVLALYRRRRTPFSEEAMLGAHAYAVLAGVGYESLVQRQRAERQMMQTGALLRVIKEIALPPQADRPVYLAILEHACSLTEAQHAKLYLWDAGRQVLVEQASIVGGQRLDQGFVLKPGEGLAGEVFARGVPIVLDDYTSWEGRLRNVSNPAIGPSMGVPVRLGDEVIGALVLGRDFPGRFFDDEDVEMAAARAAEVAIYVARARAEAERARQRAFAQTILDAMRSIVVVADALTTCTTHVNRYLLDKTGWSREEVVGKPWVDTFVPAAWRDRVKEVARRLRDQTGGYRFANPILTKDGRELFVEWHNTTVRDEDGKALYIVAVGVVAGD